MIIWSGKVAQNSRDSRLKIRPSIFPTKNWPLVLTILTLTHAFENKWQDTKQYTAFVSKKMKLPIADLFLGKKGR